MGEGGKLTLVLGLLHVQDRDLDPPLGEQLDALGADTVAPARHDDDLARPVVRVVAPVVGHARVEEVARAVEQAEQERGVQAPERGRVLRCEVGAGRREAAGEEEGKGEERVEGGAIEEAGEGVDGHAWPGRWSAGSMAMEDCVGDGGGVFGCEGMGRQTRSLGSLPSAPSCQSPLMGMFAGHTFKNTRGYHFECFVAVLFGVNPRAMAAGELSSTNTAAYGSYMRGRGRERAGESRAFGTGRADCGAEAGQAANTCSGGWRSRTHAEGEVVERHRTVLGLTPSAPLLTESGSQTAKRLSLCGRNGNENYGRDCCIVQKDQKYLSCRNACASRS